MTTPEPEQSDVHEPAVRDVDGGPPVLNVVSGGGNGVVQAGVVNGDVYLRTPPRPLSPVVPRQLPAAPAVFAGRVAELTALDRALTAADPHGGVKATPGENATGSAASPSVMISTIGGSGGIGKSWLALAWAHRNLDRFPDGQLFVDLRGFSPRGEPVGSGTAVRWFLDGLGVSPHRIPTDLAARAALYRSLVAGRRMLIVLDNAATADQVVPLLPGSPTCTVLVTSRHVLSALIDRHGARHLTLGTLTHAEARALVTALSGADRFDAEPDAVSEMVDLCGGYPLALSITARNAATRPAVPLAEVAAELHESGLEVLDHETDPTASLPTVLSWSLRYLTGEQRSLFALLGLAPGPDISLPAVAALGALPRAAARKALTALENASLVNRRSASRYAMHDLVRALAADTARATLPAHVREAALVRVVDFYSHTSHAASRLLDPHRRLVHPRPPAPGVRPQLLADVAAAMGWLEAEHAVLLATQRIAATLGQHHAVWHLAWNLAAYHSRRGHLRDELSSWSAAVDAAHHLPDPTARSCAHRFLGRACARLNLHEQATGHLDRSLALATSQDDPAERAHTNRGLALAWARRGSDRRALDHARRARDLFRSLGQPVQEALALNAMGWHGAQLGEFDTARDHCHAALALNRHRHLEGEADALDSLGFIAHRTGDHRTALDYYHRALTLFRTVGHATQTADTLDRLGHPHTALGQHEQARRLWLEALELYREQGRDIDAERVQRQLDDLADTGTNPVGP
ncbi:tetratricopeptide repeat protein [Saccharothrix variisporea]|uniref:tetratricopeptide repeat protein n=1 Tax=Saccharothrix variisporea TaxID=543527 RepID=UPI001FE982B4|nr:tetratricopeptide repeat protein [Saccharothrix variisporea]